MLRLPIELLQPGMVLAKPVVDSRGSILLRQNVTLTDEYIGNIQKRGFSSVFVTDGDTEDVLVEDILSDEVRRGTQATLSRVFDFARKVSAELNTTHVDNIVAGLHDTAVVNALRNYSGFEQLEELATAILNDIQNVEFLTVSTQMRSQDDYLFSHAIDTTVAALMLGKRLNLKPLDLNRLGAGCLLHDIGKIFFDLNALSRHIDQQKNLSPAALLRLREHTRLGYELLRARSPDAVITNHIALEHHERQDGRGFPRRLYGTNTVERPRFDRQNILLIAEIASIADAYDILSMEKPDSVALPPQYVANSLRRLSGIFLNRELVNIFLQMITVFPQGMNIIVRTGHYIGYKGVVIEANKKEFERPVVRLLYNNQGDRIAPIEINLAQDKTITVEALLNS